MQRARSLEMSAIVVLLVAAFACRADDDAPAVTPYRPSVSTPAALSAPGWLELEAGLQRDKGDRAARRESLPYTLKLAFTPDWGVRLGGEARVRDTDADGGRISGAGDTSFVLKRRFGLDEGHALGLELGTTRPTGRRGISIDKAAYTVNGIYSADLGDYHSDINLAATRLGSAEAGASRVQALWAASLSKSVDDQWGWVAELSGTRQRGAGLSGQLLAAASYNLSKQLTLDAGVARSTRSGPAQWSLFSGLTLLAARLF